MHQIKTCFAHGDEYINSKYLVKRTVADKARAFEIALNPMNMKENQQVWSIIF